MTWVSASRGNYTGLTGDFYTDSSGLFGLYPFASFPVAGTETTYLPNYSTISISAVRFTESFSIFDYPNLSARFSSIRLSIVSSTLVQNFPIIDWPKRGTVFPTVYTTLSNSSVENGLTYQYTVTLPESISYPKEVQDPSLWTTSSPQAIFLFERRAEYSGFLTPLGGDAFFDVGFEFNIAAVVPPLRMQQRDDGLSIQGHARLNQEAAQGSSSVNTGNRLKERNTYV